MRFPFSLTLYALGIDLSDGGVKCLLLAKQHGKISVVRVARGSFPDDAYKEGRIIKHDAVVTALKEAVGALALPHAPVIRVAALSDTQTFFTVVQIPTNTLAQKTILDEARKDLPIDPTSMIVDWQRLSDDPEAPTTPVFVMAADRTLVSELTTTCAGAQLFLDVIESEAIALGRVVGGTGRRAVLDLGKKRATIVALEGTTPSFVLSLPLAGTSITETIAKTLHLDSTKAEETKRRCGFDIQACQGSLKEVIQTHIEGTSQKLTTALEEARSKDEEHRPFTDLILTGGGAHLKALDGILQEKLALPVTRAALWENIEKSQTFPEDELAWTVALGLALRGLSSYAHA